jgi:hypothetical protein
MEAPNHPSEVAGDPTYSSDDEIDPSSSVNQPQLATTAAPHSHPPLSSSAANDVAEGQRSVRARRLWYSFGGKVFCVVGGFEYVSDVILAIHQQLGPRLSQSPLNIELCCDERALAAEDVASTIPKSCDVAPGNQRTCAGGGSPRAMLVAHIPALGGTAPVSSFARRSSPPARASSSSRSRAHTPSQGAAAPTRSDAEKRCREASLTLQQALSETASAIAAASAGSLTKPPISGDAAAALKSLIVKEIAEALYPVSRQVTALASAHKGLVEALEQLLKQPNEKKARSATKVGTPA